MTFAHVWIGDERSERKDERTKDRRQIYGAVNDIIVSPNVCSTYRVDGVDVAQETERN